MLTWVRTIGAATHLFAYGVKMELLAHLVEHEDRWVMNAGGRQFTVAGNGCADPVAFIEQMVSPTLPMHTHLDDSWLVQFYPPNGESWEVWGE